MLILFYSTAQEKQNPCKRSIIFNKKIYVLEHTENYKYSQINCMYVHYYHDYRHALSSAQKIRLSRNSTWACVIKVYNLCMLSFVFKVSECLNVIFRIFSSLAHGYFFLLKIWISQDFPLSNTFELSSASIFIHNSHFTWFDQLFVKTGIDILII